jgi:CRP-like cAMP-binding protein
MFERRYSDGDPIFRAGEPSDAVFRLRSGQVRLTPAGGGAARLLGPGDMLGELRLLSGGQRGEAAHAVGEVVVDVVTRADLLRMFEHEPAPARAAFNALFDHLRIAADAALALSAKTGGDAPDGPTPSLRLLPANRHVEEQIGAAGVAIAALPFSVGRRTFMSAAYDGSADLQLVDRRPHYMSRRHFAIQRLGRELMVRDCGSRSGTLVNGVAIGANGHGQTAPLQTGRNEIVAGKQESPFRFILLVAGSAP